MPDPQRPNSLEVVRGILIHRAGGYLRNVRWQLGLTCPMCAGIPSGNYQACYNCETWQHRNDLADRLGYLTYGVETTQSGHAMYAYKDGTSQHARQTVTLLVAYAVLRHWTCINSSRLGPVTHWAVVPSMRGRETLRQIVGPIMNAQRLAEVPMSAAPGAAKTRDLRPDNFTVAVPPRAHVLLIEDAWVGGGTQQSAAAALKLAGAGAVTALTIARWLSPGRGRTSDLIEAIRDDPYDPDRCPFTGSHCG